jgi:DNA-binding NtrC family response regulator
MHAVKLLLVEDDPLLGEALHEALSRKGYRTRLAPSGADALSAISCESYDLVLQDVKLPDLDGLDLLGDILTRQPRCHALVMTGQATVEMAVRAMKLGAFDFITKPFPVDVLLMKLDRLLEYRALEKQLAELTGSSALCSRFVTRSPAMRSVLDTVAVAAASEATVLLSGESGTGKELLAEAIHHGSPRANGPLVKVNCAAIPDSLIEAELFGVEKGAYTGADRSRPGYLETARGGTLFLDEVGELSPGVQAKLLRVLEEKRVTRIGSVTPGKLDFRLVCATNRDLRTMVAGGTFRDDLFYRLNVIALTITPLRERREDIPLLIAHFIDCHAQTEEKRIRLAPDALEALLRLPYPGNVRELANIIEHLSLLFPGQTIHERHLPIISAADPHLGTQFEKFTIGMPLKTATAEFERRYIERVLAASGGQKSRAAGILGISRKALWERLKEHDPAEEV